MTPNEIKALADRLEGTTEWDATDYPATAARECQEAAAALRKLQTENARLTAALAAAQERVERLEASAVAWDAKSRFRRRLSTPPTAQGDEP